MKTFLIGLAAGLVIGTAGYAIGYVATAATDAPQAATAQANQ
jgi:F0F1-type ATP synthase membrane subunit c/vacuolar-type H+-ATPase subunit K